MIDFKISLINMSAKEHYFLSNMHLKIVSSLILLSGLISANALAEDSLSSIMQRMQASDVGVKIAYQELRTLELMDQPWLGEGFMYSISPDLMIKQQITPQRLLMAVKADKMYYFDQENNIRHQGKLDSESPLTLNIAVFKVLMNADTELLNQTYQVQLESTDKRWLMTLTPKQEIEQGFNIVISGLAEQQVDTIVVHQADGDVSEFTLSDSQAGIDIKNTILGLYSELTGD